MISEASGWTEITSIILIVTDGGIVDSSNAQSQVYFGVSYNICAYWFDLENAHDNNYDDAYV